MKFRKKPVFLISADKKVAELVPSYKRGAEGPIRALEIKTGSCADKVSIAGSIIRLKHPEIPLGVVWNSGLHGQPTEMRRGASIKVVEARSHIDLLTFADDEVWRLAYGITVASEKNGIIEPYNLGDDFVSYSDGHFSWIDKRADNMTVMPFETGMDTYLRELETHHTIGFVGIQAVIDKINKPPLHDQISFDEEF